MKRFRESGENQPDLLEPEKKKTRIDNDNSSSNNEMSLPVEIMAHISSFVYDSKARTNFSLASHTFHDIAKMTSPYFWREKVQQYFSYLLRNPELLEKYTTDSGHILYEKMFRDEYQKYNSDPISIITGFYSKFQKAFIQKTFFSECNEGEEQAKHIITEAIKAALIGNIDKIFLFSQGDIFDSSVIDNDEDLEIPNSDKVVNLFHAKPVYSALHALALSNGHYDVLENINEEEKSHILSAALYYSCVNGDYSGLQQLIETYPDCKQPLFDRGQLPNFISLAVSSGNLTLVDYLLINYLQVAMPDDSDWLKKILSEEAQKNKWCSISVIAKQISLHLNAQKALFSREILNFIWDKAAILGHLPLVVNYFSEILDINHKKFMLNLLVSGGTTEVVGYLFDQLQTHLTTEEQHQLLLSSITSKNSLETFQSLWHKINSLNPLPPAVIKEAYHRASAAGRSDVTSYITNQNSECISTFDKFYGSIKYFTYGTLENPSAVFNTLATYYYHKKEESSDQDQKEEEQPKYKKPGC